MSNEKTILIVEDEIQLLDTWKEMLLHFGYKPLMAENGMKAINILNEQKVDLIITDLKMPEYDGLFLLNFLKLNIIFILLTLILIQDLKNLIIILKTFKIWISFYGIGILISQENGTHFSWD